MRIKAVTLFVWPLLLFLPGKSNGEICPTIPRVEVWPTGKTIYQNSIFIIEGGMATEFYLKSLNNDTIRLEKQDFYNGFGIDQTVFRPEKKLEAGKDYVLYMKMPYGPNGVSSYDVLYEAFDNEEKERIIKIWKVKKGSDKTSPKWKSLPILDKTGIGQFSPSGIYANFKCAISDSSEYMVRTKLTDLTSDITMEYIIPVMGSHIWISVGNCYNYFHIKEGQPYQVEFDIIDASGNITPWILRQQYSNNPYTAILPFAPRGVSPIRDDVLRFIAPVRDPHRVY